MNNPGGYEPTLCWDCANATDQEACPWVKDFTPVPGWDAEHTVKEDAWYPYESFIVRACPLFVRDGLHGGTKKLKKRGGKDK